MLVSMMNTSRQLHPYLDSICQLRTHLRDFGSEAKLRVLDEAGDIYELEDRPAGKRKYNIHPTML